MRNGQYILTPWGQAISKLAVWVGLLTLTMQLISWKSSKQLVETTIQTGRMPITKNLLKQSRTETDAAAREKILRQAEDIFMEELPLSPIYFYTNVWTNKEYVKNIEVSPLGLVQYKWGYIAE